MKRFVIDTFLILILVLLGSSYLQEDSIEEEIYEFEEKIEEKVVIDSSSTMNKATAFAVYSSHLIEEGVEAGVEFITNIFSAIIE